MLLAHWGDGGDAHGGGSPTLERRSSPIKAVTREAPHVIEQQMVTWTGPLPPPAAMREYEQILPGACERLLTMSERQMDHRHRVEREVVHAAVVVEGRGQAIAALIGVLAIVCGT